MSNVVNAFILCKSVGVEGTLYVVEDGCHTIIASTEPQW